MNITIVDRSRTVRIAPTKAVTPDSDPFDVMRRLAQGHPVENGQIVFECDLAFMDLCMSAAAKDTSAKIVPAAESNRFELGMPGTQNLPVPTFLGIPIIVRPSNESVPQAAPAPEPVIDPRPTEALPTGHTPEPVATTKNLQETA